MSRRTSEASKAIREAWEKERELVLAGKGTRDWTPEQQQSIYDKGKAYDDDGKAFEGHHMKSAEQYPEFQGDADNIQFLTRKEHQAAHNSNFQNPTNGYYDYFEGKTVPFGNNKFKPCEVIELTKPILKNMYSSEENVDTTVCEKELSNDNQNDKVAERIYSDEGELEELDEDQQRRREHEEREEATSTGKESFLTKVGRKYGEFRAKHPTITKVVRNTFKVVCVVGSAAIVGSMLSSKRGKNGSGLSDHFDELLGSKDTSDDGDEEVDDVFDRGILSTTEESVSDELVYSGTGTPKSPHPRTGYLGHRWKKNNDSGELELKESWISETYIHEDQIEDDAE